MDTLKLVVISRIVTSTGRPCLEFQWIIFANEIDSYESQT